MSELLGGFAGLLSPSVWAWIVGGLAAVLALLTGLFYKVERAGVNKQKAKELDAYEKHLEEIRKASYARPAGSVHDDPNNRDNRT